MNNGPIPQTPATSDWSPTGGYGSYKESHPQGHMNGGQHLGGNGIGPRTQNHLTGSTAPDTPPVSGHNSAGSGSDGGLQNMPRRNPNLGNPSPPASIAGSVAGSMTSERRLYMEEQLSEHYRVLKNYLREYLQEQALDPRGARARDKLVRLSTVQFQELSTDVYDELLRREDERQQGGRDAPGNQVPHYLLPRQNFHVKRNQARQKLSTLPTDRFRQLATDVFWELERRVPRFSALERPSSRSNSLAGSIASGFSGFGPPARARTPNGLPPRSDSRGIGDQRPPPMPSDYGRPMPKTYHSDTIIPNKGLMVEDEENDSVVEETLRAIEAYRIQVAELEAKVEKLEHELATKTSEAEKDRSATSDAHEAKNLEWDNLRSSLEQKLMEAQSLNDAMRLEIDKVRNESMTSERDLRSQLDQSRQSERDLERDLRSQLDLAKREVIDVERALKAELDVVRSKQQDQSANRPRSMTSSETQLRSELEEQKHISDEVRRDAARFLQDMRDMAQQSAGALEKEAVLINQVNLLEREIREWKDKYAKVKSQTQSLRASSQGLSIINQDAPQYSRFVSVNGQIKDFHVAHYQVAIDELLRAGRKPDATELMLDCMKQVIMNVRSIAGDVNLVTTPLTGSDSGDSATGPDVTKEKLELKSKLSKAVNNLIVAVRAHVSASGLAPISLLDAAASNLTIAVVDLIKMFQINSSSPGEEASEEAFEYDYQPTRMNALKNAVAKPNGAPTSHPRQNGSDSHDRVNGFQPSGHARMSSMSSNGYSAYSRYSRYSQSEDLPIPISSSMKGLGIHSRSESSPALTIKDWRNYLEDSTASLVRAIQPLVNTLRSNSDITTATPAIRGYVQEISRTVEDVTERCDNTLLRLSKGEFGPAMTKHISPLIMTLEECRVALTKAGLSKDSAPPVAFKIARATKELVSRIDRIEKRELTAKMDSSADV